MHPRTALALALAAGAAAVAVVAADTVLGLEARLETFRDGEWSVVSASESAYARHVEAPRPIYGPGCATPTMRFTLVNDKPLPDTVTVEAYWDDHFGRLPRDTRILRETWELAAWETRTREFTVPEEARPPPPENAEPRWQPTAGVNVRVEGMEQGWFSACVAFPEASS